MTTNSEITGSGLWTSNVALVQLLGLCPLLAVTSTVVNGVGLGLATMVTLIASNTLVSLIRGFVRSEVRLPVFVLIIACVVTMIELAMKAFFYDLYLVLGIFIPLIVTNCAIVARAEVFASRNPVGSSIVDGIVMGMGFALLLIVIGVFREVVAMGWSLAVLPPGAFFSLALAIAAKNMLDKRRQERRADALPRRARRLNR